MMGEGQQQPQGSFIAETMTYRLMTSDGLAQFEQW